MTNAEVELRPISSEFNHREAVAEITRRILEACDELQLAGGDDTVRAIQVAATQAQEQRQFVDLSKF